MRRKIKFYAILVVLAIVFTCGYWVSAHLSPHSPVKPVHSEEAVPDKSHRVPVVITPVSMRNFENN